MGDISNVNKAGINGITNVIPLWNLSNFWKMLNIPLINCAVSLTLSKSENCVMLNKTKRDAVADTRLTAKNISDILSVNV